MPTGDLQGDRPPAATAPPFRLLRAASRHFILFLTVRYLLRRPLSVLVVIFLAVAVWALVLAPSVMNGFQAEFHTRVRGTLSDLTLACERPFAITRDTAFEAALARAPGVTAVAPYLENPALDKHLTKIDYCFLRGVEPRLEAKVSDFAKYLLSPLDEFKERERYDQASAAEKRRILEQGEALGLAPKADVEHIFRLLEAGDPDHPGVATCLVGIYFFLTYENDITMDLGRSSLGSIRLTTASDTAEVKQDKRLMVVGTFRTGFYNNDRHSVYTSLEAAQELVSAPGRVSGYSIKLDDYEAADAVREVVKAVTRRAVNEGVLPERGCHVRTWEEKDENLLRAVRMEKLLIRLITGMIVMVASSSILMVLIMTALSKVRELGILRAMGASRFGVFLLFLGQGLVIATCAVGVGCAAGVITSQYINELAALIHRLTGWHPFPPDVYYLDAIPTRIVTSELIEDFGVTLAFAVGAAFIPAFIAALRPPIRAIRYE